MICTAAVHQWPSRQRCDVAFPLVIATSAVGHRVVFVHADEIRNEPSPAPRNHAAHHAQRAIRKDLVARGALIAPHGVFQQAELIHGLEQRADAVASELARILGGGLRYGDVLRATGDTVPDDGL